MTSDCTFCAGTGKLASCEATTFQGVLSRRNWVRDCQQCEGAGKVNPETEGQGRAMGIIGLVVTSPSGKGHLWQPSRLGHGEAVCAYCHGTNREIAVIGDLNRCDKAPRP